MKIASLMTQALPHTVFEEAALAREENAAREERFAELVRRQSRFVFRVAFAVLRNVHDAEDAAQEVFLKLYRARGWDAIEDERAFLARAAWRAAVDKRRTPRMEDLPEQISSGAADPERALMNANAEAVIHRLIDGLPAKLRYPLALSAIDELDSAAIGRILGISENAVRRRIMRARALVRTKFEALMEKRHG